MIYLFAPTHGARSQQVFFGEFLCNHEENFKILSEHEQILDLKIKPGDLFLCGIPVDNYKKNIETIRFLKSKNAKVFFLMDHWHNSWKNFYDEDTGSFVLPEKIFCIDEHMKEFFTSGAIPSKILYVAGHPALEETYSKKLRSETIVKIKKDQGISKKIITLYLDPVPRDRKIEIGYSDEDVVRMVCEVFQNFNQSHALLIKSHPRTKISSIERALGTFDRKNIFLSHNLKNIGNNEILNISDCVIGMTSIMLAHSLVLKKPTLSIQINPTATGRLRSNHILDNIKAERSDQVFSFLEKEQVVKNLIDTCIFTEACSKIYREME